LDELKAFLATSKGAESDLDSLKLCNADIPSIDLDFTHLQKSYPNAHSFIYENMSLQCRNCGIRFYDNNIERVKFDRHLDMHFKKATRGQLGKLLSRRWFLSEEEWVNYCISGSIDVIDTNHKYKHDVLPTLIKSEGIMSCAICHEKFDSFWDSNEDEWMLKDAIKNNRNQICHSECFQDN
jgi:pre-mRNA cleavage complex 2 protein Pcf11